MILYRIINEDEYNAIKAGKIDLLEKVPANESSASTSRVYEQDRQDNNNQYLYFFEDVAACENGWNGDYIVQVNIPEEKLEKGYGRYASLNSALSLYITMDEYRIKKEDFIPQEFILGIVPKDEIPKDWYETSDKYLEAMTSALNQVYLSLDFVNKKAIKLDASGLRGEAISHFNIPNELNGVCQKIYKALYSNSNDIKSYEYNPNDMYINSMALTTVQSMLQKISKSYSVEQIESLFEGNISKTRLFDILEILTIGEIEIFESCLHIADRNEIDLKFMVSSTLANADISEENYNSTRKDICAFFNEYGDIVRADEIVKQEAFNFIFLSGTRFNSSKLKLFRFQFIREIGDFFAHCPENATEAAKFFFEEQDEAQPNEYNSIRKKYIYGEIKCYETLYRSIEQYNSNKEENSIPFNSIIDLFKKLEEMEVNFGMFNREQKDFFKSSQILELLNKENQNPNFEQDIVDVLQQFNIISKGTSHIPRLKSLDEDKKTSTSVLGKQVMSEIIDVTYTDETERQEQIDIEKIKSKETEEK